MKTLVQFFIFASLHFASAGSSHAAPNDSDKGERMPDKTPPMNIFFLGDICKIEMRQFDLQEDVLLFVTRQPPAQIIIRVCPLIPDRDAAQFRAALVKVYSGEVSEKRLAANAIECARNRTKAPARRV